jgi:hypothetical protein
MNFGSLNLFKTILEIANDLKFTSGTTGWNPACGPGSRAKLACNGA